MVVESSGMGDDVVDSPTHVLGWIAALHCLRTVFSKRGVRAAAIIMVVVFWWPGTRETAATEWSRAQSTPTYCVSSDASAESGRSAEPIRGKWKLHVPEQVSGPNRMQGDLEAGKVTLDGGAGCFAYVQVEGDFQLDVRLVGLDGDDVPRASADVRLAEGLDDDSLRDSIVWGKRAQEYGGPSKENPEWLRIMRVGRNVGVYHSWDGRRFQNRPSGRTLASGGPVYVGMTLLAGDADAPIRATFDQIRVTRPRLDYRTSWLGNTLPGPVSVTVSFNMTGLFTAPDGTCYTTSFFEEQGHCIAAYRDGRQVAPLGKTQTAGIAVCANATHVFTSHKGITQE